MKKNLSAVFIVILFGFTSLGQKMSLVKKALFDSGHYNIASGSYYWLEKLLSDEGFSVTYHKKRFDKKGIEKASLLIIVNPLAEPKDSSVRRGEISGELWSFSSTPTQNAYTKGEVSVIETWVRKGGSLFLVLDHAPHAKNAESLAASFGVETHNVFTYDSLHQDKSEETPTILFTRQSGIVSNHPILKGVDSVVTFTGQSLSGPLNSVILLQLSSSAYDKVWKTIKEFKLGEYKSTTASGLSQGLAIEHGKGRVVVLGEAAMTAGAGIERTDRGNKQLVLNIIRWLAREKME